MQNQEQLLLQIQMLLTLTRLESFEFRETQLQVQTFLLVVCVYARK